MSRSKSFINNSIASLAQQIVALAVGIILPKLIITHYGSATNGAIASITQFISITALIQGGVSSASRVAFYEPVAKNDSSAISNVYNYSKLFFNKFGAFLFVYILILALFYPRFFDIPFDGLSAFLLITIIGMTAIFEYLFGIVNQLLLFADQKGYVNTIIQTICTFTSATISVVLILLGQSIITVKFLAAIILILRPICLNHYVKKHYEIDKKILMDKSVLSKSNAALTKSIAYYVHNSTDNLVITAFLNVSWVSVYAVHRYISNSISSLVSSILGNTESIFGQIIGTNEYNSLEREVPVYDLISKILSAVFFFPAISLITKFINIYTVGINDAVYYQPLFGIVLCASELVYCMSLTYNNLIMAAGHIKETKWISIVEATINIVLSVLLVNKYGIIGVAIGTLVAFIFNTVANVIYVYKKIYKINIFMIVRMYVVNISFGIIATLICLYLFPSCGNYFSFFFQGTLVFLIHIIIIIIGNCMFFNQYLGKMFSALKNKIL